jgi:hypothetical protein
MYMLHVFNGFLHTAVKQIPLPLRAHPTKNSSLSCPFRLLPMQRRCHRRNGHVRTRRRPLLRLAAAAVQAAAAARRMGSLRTWYAPHSQPSPRSWGALALAACCTFLYERSLAEVLTSLRTQEVDMDEYGEPLPFDKEVLEEEAR